MSKEPATYTGNRDSPFPNWLLGDHLGSTSMVADAGGTVVNELRYSAFGEIRYQSGTLTTDYLYTGQRQEAEIGLYYFVARWYDPAIGRFIQADSIVPNPGIAAGFDRYNYSWNNPIKFADPSGHSPSIYMDGEQLAYMDNSFSSHISTSSSQYSATWKPPRKQPNKPWDGHKIWPDDEYLFGKTPENFSMTNEEIFLGGFQSPLDDPNNYGGFGADNTLGGPGYHPGIDSRTIYGPPETITINWRGRPIYSVYDGVVSNTGTVDGFGNFVVVEHSVYGTNYYSVYAHLDSVDVNEGEKVSLGTKIGEMGNSGTGDPHLHFEVRKENNISIGNQNPFSGHVWWPGSYSEFQKNFVDLGQLPYVTNEGFGQ